MNSLGAPLALALALALASVASCATLGWEFAPGASSRDAFHFATPPSIEHRVNGEFLVWTFGTGPFFALPSYRPVNGRLVFSLQGSSSSGNVAGRHGELRIEGREALAALARGGAYWWEPDRSFVPLARVSAPGAAP